MNQPHAPEYPAWVTDFLERYASAEFKRDLARDWKIICEELPITNSELYEVVRNAVANAPEKEGSFAAVEAVRAALSPYAHDHLRKPSAPPEYPDWVTDFVGPYASEEVKCDLAEAWKIICGDMPINYPEIYGMVRNAIESLPEEERSIAAVDAAKVALNQYADDHVLKDGVWVGRGE